ncbi:MAG: hypothetical protein ACKV0T_17440, partial [Planctomycetales bacterium]
MRRFVITVLAVSAWGLSLRAGEIDFVEDFALSPDRQAALRQLIPGTDDYFYYHALEALHREQFDKAQELIGGWVEKHGETPRVWEIRTRMALLTYERQPQKSLEYLRQRLGVQFLHQKEELGAEPNLPTALDAALISRGQFLERARSVTRDNLDGYEDAALDWLVGADLTPNERRSLLARLARPDHEKLPQIVMDDLRHIGSGGFGSLGIHQQLLLSQMEELRKLHPDLLNQPPFVVAWLRRLQPGADENWRYEPKTLEAYLERLATFASRLAPAHNSLKAHVAYHRLLLDRSRGQFHKGRFLEYLKLPRPVGYASQKMLESDAVRTHPCDLNANYEGATLLPPIGDDEPLVRSYLAHFLVEAQGTGEFEPFINGTYLKHLFAETKIVHGLGNAEEWAALLPPELFRQLKERIDIDFAYTNQTRLGAEDAVALEVHVKNVSTLIVKVFEINTRNYYRDQQREIDTDINLDGLVANSEQTYTYADPPLRRVTRRFEFPALNRAGVYVIDFIGNGRSSRALVRKGRLHHLVTRGAAGQVFTVLDERRQPVRNARLWLAGQEYAAAEDGRITVPFSTQPARQAFVLTAPVAGGNPPAKAAAPPATLSSLDYFVHELEGYSLACGFYVDREALLQRQQAEVVIRPALLVNGTPVSLKLLEEVKLTITSTDLDGIATSQELPKFALFEDRETTHVFQVPPRLASIQFSLTGQVKRITRGGEPIQLAAAENFTLNEIERTEKIEDLHLLQAQGEYFLELRGKSGEPRGSRPVALSLKHRDFRAPLGVVLKTSAEGRITLGKLAEIAQIQATGPEGTAHAWVLNADRHTYPAALQGRVGEPLQLPYLPREGLVPQRDAPADKPLKVARSEVSLLELRGEMYVADRFENLSLKDGLLVIDKLPAGDFDLYLKSTGARIRLRIAEGPRLGRFVTGRTRQLETPALAPLQIAAISAQPDAVQIRLSNASKFARVHLFATRYVPEYDAFAALSKVRGTEPSWFLHFPPESVYLTGRNIGDEYRYIIDRRYARKYPGNMLDRPSLLLNPWAVRETQTGAQVAAAGDEFGAVGAPAPSESAGGILGGDRPHTVAGHFANLDFLAEPSVALLNLVPDDRGVIQIERKVLGGHQYLTVVAVDPVQTTLRTQTLEEPRALFTDLRLRNALDPQGHFTRQKQISIVPAGQAFGLADITTSKFEVYDSLERVYGLYATLSRDPKLVELGFLLQWPKLTLEERRTLYSKHASHELSFFLSKKDPEFFRTVVLPYLAHKKDKTFLDRYLLGDDLAEFLLPWNHAQLNVVERILLAQRLPDERPRTARHVADLFALLPPDTDGFLRLFETAVKAGGLETEDRLGVK